jgi:hypothetical protein
MQGQGKCLCGVVQATAKNVSQNLGVCHCTMCRKWGGGPWMGVDCGTEVSWEGEDNLVAYPSSDWAERGFCKKCGTHLFYRLKASKQHFIAAALFDDIAHFQFDHQVFIDEKPDYYNFAEKTHTMTGAEVFAKYSSK